MKHIILIDDDSISNFVNSQLLLQTRFVEDVKSIESAEEAIEHFEKIKQGTEVLPDLVLVDIRMPVMDGFALAEELLQRFPELNGNVLFYFLSSSLDPKDEEISNNHPLSSGFLRKPLSKAYIEQVFR